MLHLGRAAACLQYSSSHCAALSAPLSCASSNGAAESDFMVAFKREPMWLQMMLFQSRERGLGNLPGRRRSSLSGGASRAPIARHSCSGSPLSACIHVQGLSLILHYSAMSNQLQLSNGSHFPVCQSADAWFVMLDMSQVQKELCQRQLGLAKLSL